MRLANSGGEGEVGLASSRTFKNLVSSDSKLSPEIRSSAMVSDNRMNSFSNGALTVPDGQTSDPFPASLVAYIEIIRSVTEYLREQGFISRSVNEPPAEAIMAVSEELDVDEPTTFAVGEEEHAACASAGPTPAIGEAT